MIWAVLALVILLGIGWLFFMPLVVEIDTEQGTYSIRQAGTLRFWLGSDWRPNLRLSGITIPMPTTPRQKKQTPPERPGSSRTRKRTFSVASICTLARGIFRSIAVRQFWLDIDTDDVVLNAQMIPVFQLLSQGPVHLSVNFNGRLYTRLYAEIRIYKVSWAVLLFALKNKLLWK